MSSSVSECDGGTGVVCTPEEILSYWFSGTDEERKIRHWYGCKETDDEIRVKFAPTWTALLPPSDDTLAKNGKLGGYVRYLP